MKDNKQRLFEVMGRLDKTFKPSAELLAEWNFDKKKGEDEEDKEEKLEKEEGKESKISAEEKEELKEDDDSAPKVKIPTTNWDKAKHGK